MFIPPWYQQPAARGQQPITHPMEQIIKYPSRARATKSQSSFLFGNLAQNRITKHAKFKTISKPVPRHPETNKLLPRHSKNEPDNVTIPVSTKTLVSQYLLYENECLRARYSLLERSNLLSLRLSARRTRKHHLINKP